MYFDNIFSHEGPVWQVSWAHPMFGNLLASCSYDRKVSVINKPSNKSSIVIFLVLQISGIPVQLRGESC